MRLLNVLVSIVYLCIMSGNCPIVCWGEYRPNIQIAAILVVLEVSHGVYITGVIAILIYDSFLLILF